MRALEQYLSRYSEAECAQLAGLPGRYQHGLVIPVYAETIDVLARFSHWAETHPGTLLVIVVNRPDDDNENQWAQAWLNEKLSEKPEPHAMLWQSTNKHLQLRRLTTSPSADNGSACLLVDRCINGSPLPRRQGVGLARKIGADILCRLIANKQISCRYIFTTDADASLSENYFSVAAKHPSNAALIYPFCHRPCGDIAIDTATQHYEWSLRYYVAGLQFAGSPYAFHTIGSALAVDYQSYAQVRGCPCRAGGEDFYLLNKLAKTGDVTEISGALITLQSRRSSRTPFGTGPAVERLIDNPLNNSVTVYHPDCFHQLKDLLLHLHIWAENPDHPLLSIDGVWQTLPVLAPLPNILDHCRRQSHNYAGRIRHLHSWFDAFRTLKLIHQLRDTVFGTADARQLWQLDPHKQPFPLPPPPCAPFSEPFTEPPITSLTGSDSLLS